MTDIDVPDGWERIEQPEEDRRVGEEEGSARFRRDDGAEVDVLEIEAEKSGDWAYLVRAEPSPDFDDLEEPTLGTFDDLDGAVDRAADFMTDHPP